jgi:hypothetical protein
MTNKNKRALEIINGFQNGLSTDWSEVETVFNTVKPLLEAVSNIVLCSKCEDTGVIETGNNDFACSCPAGDTAMFNVSGHDGPISGAKMKRRRL